MRTSFHHQPEAQHPNFLLSTTRQPDYPIYRGKTGQHMLTASFSHFDPSATLGGRVCCDAQRGISWTGVVGCDPRLMGAQMRRRKFITLPFSARA